MELSPAGRVPALDAERAMLVVVDMQEAFRPAIANFDEVTKAIELVLRAAPLLGVPVLLTEQYPRGLGGTIPELAAHLADAPRLEKTAFAATAASGFDLRGRTQVLLCGIEAHVCVQQTAAGLLSDEVDVHVLEDAISSRRPTDRRTGLERMVEEGARRSCVEMALFQLLGDAGSPAFKQVQSLILGRGVAAP